MHDVSHCSPILQKDCSGDIIAIEKTGIYGNVKGWNLYEKRHMRIVSGYSMRRYVCGLWFGGENGLIRKNGLGKYG